MLSRCTLCESDERIQISSKSSTVEMHFCILFAFAFSSKFAQS